MYCRICGNELSEDVEFCPVCGADVYPKKKQGQIAPKLERNTTHFSDVVTQSFISIIISLCIGIGVYVFIQKKVSIAPYDAQPTVTVYDEDVDDYDEEYEDDYDEEYENDCEEIDAQNYTSEYVIANSDTRILTEDDLLGLSKEDLRLARNEIYARHGRKFNDQYLQDYFNHCSWYQGIIEPEDFTLSDIEFRNKDIILAYEEKINTEIL